VFWMTAIGALNWAAVAGVLAMPVVPDRIGSILRRASLIAAVAIIGMYALSGARQIESVRQVQQLSDEDRAIRLLSEDLETYLAGKKLSRPLFEIAQGAWGEAAGLVLERYRRGAPVAVSADLVWFYGEPLAPTGNEDGLFVIADPKTHEELSKLPRDVVVAHRGQVYIHTGVRLPDELRQGR
jgi:hypothetical protein